MESSGDQRDAVHACEQLAMHYERRVKDLQLASEFAGLALSKLTRVLISLSDPYAAIRIARLEEKLKRRVTRLNQRMARPPLL